jgi:STE24 endopeptidase
VNLRRYFSEQEIERGSRYTRPQLALAAARSLLELGTLAAVVRRPPRALRRSYRRPALAGAAAAAALAAALSVPPIPLRAIARRRALAIGLVTQSWRGWGIDIARSTGIDAALAAGAGSAAVWVTRRYPQGWWGPLGAGSVAIGAVLTAIAPVVIDPIFNDFTPLAEGQTRADVIALAEAAGVSVGEVYSIDASRRTTAANAYVTGLGPTKRVVLFDTLLDRYSRDEVRLVVAHELAHVRHRDLIRGLTYAAVVAPAAAHAVQHLSWRLSPERGTPGALPALALASALVLAPIGIPLNRLSRALERSADAYSLELTGAPDAFVSMERRLALQNVADLEPPRRLSWLSTHPPTGERIGMALSFETQQARGAGP